MPPTGYPPMRLHQVMPQPAKRTSTGKVLAIVGASVAGVCLLGCIGLAAIGAVSGDKDKQHASAVATATVASGSTSRPPLPQPVESQSPLPGGWTYSPLPSYSTTPPPAPTTTTPPPGIYDEGVLLVPTEVKPGTYRATVPAGGHCYWARLKGTSGSFDEIIANGNGGPGSKVTVTVKASDKALEQHGCGTWTKIG